MAKINFSNTSPHWLWIAVIWSAGGVIEATQTVFIMFAEGRHHPWFPLFATELAVWIPWAIATPAVGQLALRFPIAPSARTRTIFLHFAMFGILTVATEIWSAFLQVKVNPWEHKVQTSFFDTWGISLLYQILMFFIVYTLIVTVTLVLDSRLRMSRQRIESAKLKEELAKAQLAALQQQMEPHFMFNTLNAIAGLIRNQEGDAAVSMVVGLSEFLRRASENSHRAQVALAEEVEYLQRYLEIQKARFGDRLRVGVDIPRKLLEAQVPSLLLQPLVENAIKHGISKRVAGGTVIVEGRQRDGDLQLRVYNEGPFLPLDWEATPYGVGLSNLRARLEILYKNRSGLQISRVNSEGVEVSTIHVGIRTNGVDPSVKLTLRDGDRVVADFEQDVRVYTVLNPPVHKAGSASRQLHLDPPQLLSSLSIDVNVPAVEAANMTLFAKPSMQAVYAGIEKWRQAPLVSADLGTHTLTFANPFERPLISIGRLTFLPPIDSALALSSFGCQTPGCSGPTEKYAARSLPRSPVHGLSDSAPTTLIPLDAKHYYRVVLQSDAASAPTLDVGYSDAGLVFTADGKPPYVLVASPKVPQRARIGYGGDRFEARTQPMAVTATLSGYSVVDRTRFFGFTQIGPIVFFIMLFIGFDWALDWRIGRRLTREWPRGSRAD